MERQTKLQNEKRIQPFFCLLLSFAFFPTENNSISSAKNQQKRNGIELYVRCSMQLNGTEGNIMAASDPPEPPPRNPDKINASLKQTSETVIYARIQFMLPLLTHRSIALILSLIPVSHLSSFTEISKIAGCMRSSGEQRYQ